MAKNTNYPTMLQTNKSSSSTTIQNGNLYMPGVSYDSTAIGSVGVSSGKWYYELRVGHNYGSYFVFGWCIANIDDTYLTEISSSQTGSLNWSQLGTVVINGSNQSPDPTVPSYYNTNTKVVGTYLDLDNNKVYWHGDNNFVQQADGTARTPTAGNGFDIPAALQGQIFYPMVGTNKTGAPSNTHVNFGQDSSFQGNETRQNNSDSNGFGDFFYAPSTGYLSLCDANMPTDTNIDASETDDNFPSKSFKSVVYTGNRVDNSTENSINCGFQPDLVWIKAFSGTSQTSDHRLTDSSRGATKIYRCNENTQEQTETNGVKSFNTNGFTVGGDNNYNNGSTEYVAWCWKANGGVTSSNSDGSVTTTVQANQAAGFSIVTYTGTGSAGATIGHGLGKKPKWIMVKNRTTARNNACYHIEDNANGTKALLMNTANSDTSNYWNGTQPTSSVITLGSETEVNQSGNDMVAYVWTDISGFSSFGKYVGNGSTDGPYIATGFRPAMIWTFKVNTASGFRVRDTARDTFNPSDSIVWWNLNFQQYNSSGYNVDIFSNGFKLTNGASDFNTDGDTFIYGAWADTSAKFSNAF